MPALSCGPFSKTAFYRKISLSCLSQYCPSWLPTALQDLRQNSLETPWNMLPTSGNFLSGSLACSNYVSALWHQQTEVWVNPDKETWPPCSLTHPMIPDMFLWNRSRIQQCCLETISPQTISHNKSLVHLGINYGLGKSLPETSPHNYISYPISHTPCIYAGLTSHSERLERNKHFWNSGLMPSICGGFLSWIQVRSSFCTWLLQYVFPCCWWLFRRQSTSKGIEVLCV